MFKSIVAVPNSSITIFIGIGHLVDELEWAVIYVQLYTVGAEPK